MDIGARCLTMSRKPGRVLKEAARRRSRPDLRGPAWVLPSLAGDTSVQHVPCARLSQIDLVATVGVVNGWRGHGPTVAGALRAVGTLSNIAVQPSVKLQRIGPAGGPFILVGLAERASAGLDCQMVPLPLLSP